jgi:hypothetical protein
MRIASISLFEASPTYDELEPTSPHREAEERAQRRLAAITAADVVGCTKRLPNTSPGLSKTPN